MKKNILLIALTLLSQIIFAQQDAQYTQYMYNTISVNPAYSGSRGALSINALHRSQWVGLKGAPETQTISLNTPLNNNRVGIGFSIVNDKIGPTQETYFDAAFSYTVPVSDNGKKLSFGLKAGGHLMNIDFTKLNQYYPQLTSNSNIDNKFSPNVGAGIYYHTNNFYVGLSVPNFLETRHFDESSDANESSSFIAKERMNYYLIAGYVFNLSYNWDFKPALLTKMVTGAPLQADISASFLYKQKLTLGAAYRWSAAWSAMAGFQISDSLMLGFAYDKETTDLGNTSFNDGSYEVFIRFELFKNIDKVISPRFF